MTEISSRRPESDLSHSHHLRADRPGLALTPRKRREGHMSASALNKWKPLRGLEGTGEGWGYGKGAQANASKGPFAHAKGPESDTNLDVPIDGGYQ